MPKTRKIKTTKRSDDDSATTRKIAEDGPILPTYAFDISTPPTRPLRCYAFDPSVGTLFGNEMTLNVKYEKLLPGPVGDRIAVIDYDGENKVFYKPVDLDHPNLLI